MSSQYSKTSVCVRACVRSCVYCESFNGAPMRPGEPETGTTIGWALWQAPFQLFNPTVNWECQGEGGEVIQWCTWDHSGSKNKLTSAQRGVEVIFRGTTCWTRYTASEIEQYLECTVMQNKHIDSLTHPKKKSMAFKSRFTTCMHTH